MKKIILLVTALFSSSIFAATVQWSDLEQYNEYRITQDVAFESGITLPAGDVYELREVEPVSIPGYPMMYYGLHQKNCTNPDQTADISVVEIEGQQVVVGALLEEGCNLGLYLDMNDYYTDSAFEE